MSDFFPSPQIEKASLTDSMDSYQSPVLLEAGPQTVLISPLKNLVKDQLIIEVGFFISEVYENLFIPFSRHELEEHHSWS